jgi:hypothetical protein
MLWSGACPNSNTHLLELDSETAQPSPRVSQQNDFVALPHLTPGRSGFSLMTSVICPDSRRTIGRKRGAAGEIEVARQGC